ncbi:odorant-binding protein-like [Arvicola amphibius]|uniref:odorant-binding protein-like n=1 Tax=Arvicola amphibius TaxID=1047088 RepID=UPI001C085E48|nr:odorant-binding protein-like [Arvicola amphibius]
MVMFLLLALAFGLAHAHAEIDGKWVTIAIAADNVNKIEEGGPLRIYLRELTCTETCDRLGVTFYIKENGQCMKTKVIGNRQEDGKYRAQFEGDNTFGPVYATPEFTNFANHNVDRTGQTTNVIYVFGKGQLLTPDQYEKIEEFAKVQNIPTENIQDVWAIVYSLKPFNINFHVCQRMSLFSVESTPIESQVQGIGDF